MRIMDESKMNESGRIDLGLGREGGRQKQSDHWFRLFLADEGNRNRGDPTFTGPSPCPGYIRSRSSPDNLSFSERGRHFMADFFLSLGRPSELPFRLSAPLSASLGILLGYSHVRRALILQLNATGRRVKFRTLQRRTLERRDGRHLDV